ncbi:MAG: hypothetical protein FWE90_01525 [Defluviitaleaceae bacterium]|nr:hypothetical protein [Defluviitaleaceae bacterium]
METVKKRKNTVVSIKLNFKKNGEPIEKILREVILQYIRSELKSGWSPIPGGTPCIQK